jgi:protein gp37
VGGESGPGFRPMDHDWARSVRDQCDEAGVAFFMKQSAGIRTEMGIELDGVIRRDYPQYPAVQAAQPV